MSDTLKALNEAYNTTTALEAVEDTRGVAGTNAAAQPDDPGARRSCPRPPSAGATASRHHDHPLGTGPAPRLSPGRNYPRQEVSPPVRAQGVRGAPGQGSPGHGMEASRMHRGYR